MGFELIIITYPFEITVDNVAEMEVMEAMSDTA